MSNNTQPDILSRRTFFKRAGGTAAGVAAVAALLAGTKKTATNETPEPMAEIGGASETMRMHNDLQRALAKKPEERRWAMVIDTRRCIGCNACTAACIAENNLPPGVTYRTVPEIESGEYPNVQRHFMPTNCMQCDNAPCIEAANKVIPGAMFKRPDGIVEIDYTKMKGREVFEAAKSACPYTALYFDEGKNYTDGTPAVQPYEKRAVSEYDKTWTRQQTAGATRKCHFCTQRLAAGQLPACVATCTGLAMHFGDLNDPESLVAQMMKSNRLLRLEESQGTEPRVFYLADRPEETCMACHSF
jgi:molybdopterin-containing oxidoreductase family iron-sulfur binding subunit